MSKKKHRRIFDLPQGICSTEIVEYEKKKHLPALRGDLKAIPIARIARYEFFTQAQKVQQELPWEFYWDFERWILECKTATGVDYWLRLAKSSIKELWNEQKSEVKRQREEKFQRKKKSSSLWGIDTHSIKPAKPQPSWKELISRSYTHKPWT